MGNKVKPTTVALCYNQKPALPNDALHGHFDYRDKKSKKLLLQDL